MSTHPKHAMTNGNGHGSTKKLERLLAYHEHNADALRTTLALLRGEAVEQRAKRAPDVLAAAVALDAVRRTAHPRHDKTETRARRARTAVLLAQFDLHTPRRANQLPASPANRGIGGLVRGGLLKRTKGGYVRTAKPFAVGE
jgi:hypothetical protein